jgi:hypothetical protein
MRYRPTVDLWEPGVIDSILTGSLRLQPGQWVTCGNTRRSRFAGASSRTIVATHPRGEEGVCPETFRAHRTYALSIGSR